MALASEFSPSPLGLESASGLGQLPYLANHQPSDEEMFSKAIGTDVPSFPDQQPTPQFVQPQQLHASPSASPESQVSPLYRPASIDSSSSYGSLTRQRTLRRLSLVTAELSPDESYRPRHAPTRPRRGTTSRITPRSEKHARELELNRKAATKCRNRQKLYIEQLQQRCRKEEEKMHVQSSLVQALHDEVVALRNEVLRQSLCDCRFLRRPSTL